MKFAFRTPELVELYTQGKGRADYPEGVSKAFVRRIELIRSAADARDLRNIQGAHFEKLRSKPGVYSMRLGKQYRLELTFKEDESGEQVVLIDKISKHYE